MVSKQTAYSKRYPREITKMAIHIRAKIHAPFTTARMVGFIYCRHPMLVLKIQFLKFRLLNPIILVKYQEMAIHIRTKSPLHLPVLQWLDTFTAGIRCLFRKSNSWNFVR